MSIGNLKTNGNKGNNFPFQLSNLELLGEISAGVNPPGGLATELTALQILMALQDGQEFEQNLVMDLGGVGCPTNCPTYLQVRIWNTVTHTFDPPIYYNASGVVVVPVGPLEIVNPQYALENILLQVTAINADLDVLLSTRNAEATQLLIQALLTTIDGDTSNLDVALSTRASEATVATLLTTAAFQARINTLGQKLAADSTPVVLASDQSGIPITVTTLPLPTGAATAALQTQPGVDIGDVTVNNAAGASAVNIQDGGNSITIDAVSLPLPTGAATQATLLNLLTQSTSKINRIQGSANYSRALTYDLVGTENVLTITHTGTTLVGAETIIETITYVNPAVNGSNVTNIVYS